MAKKSKKEKEIEKKYKEKYSDSDFKIIQDSLFVSAGLLISLLAKNAVAELDPASQQSFYPYAIELGSGIGLALISRMATGEVSKPLFAGSLVAMALTGVSAITANTNESMLFQTAPKFLAY